LLFRPSGAVWVSIPIHLLAGLAILVGYKTRWAAAVLLLLGLGTAFGVHLPAGDTENMINFYKNLVMAGGFLYVINFGAGVLSFDDGVPAR
jgi:putative oxidoreductase